MATLAEQIKRLYAKPLVQMRNLILLQLVTGKPGIVSNPEKVKIQPFLEAEKFTKRYSEIMKIKKLFRTFGLRGDPPCQKIIALLACKHSIEQPLCAESECSCHLPTLEHLIYSLTVHTYVNFDV